MIKEALQYIVISIHALFAEGDLMGRLLHCLIMISIHALFAEGDPRRRRAIRLGLVFLSTPSSQRATADAHDTVIAVCISIHALFAEGDGVAVTPSTRASPFLSTPSSQRATCRILFEHRADSEISIHALFAEGDQVRGGASCLGKLFLSTPSSQRATGCPCSEQSGHRNFYPRPLRRGRHLIEGALYCDRVFLSTPSSQRATLSDPEVSGKLQISIHALFAEGDGL